MANRLETTRLERQVRRWRTAAVCFGVLAVVGGPLGAVLAQVKATDAARLRAARPAEIVTIDIPAGAELSIRSTEVAFSADAREHSLSGATQLSWKNGVKIQSDRATVRMVRDSQTGAARVFIEPRTD